jgi:hypothetical protein
MNPLTFITNLKARPNTKRIIVGCITLVCIFLVVAAAYTGTLGDLLNLLVKLLP